MSPGISCPRRRHHRIRHRALAGSARRPFELYTGHGIWAGCDDDFTYSLEDKTLVRIDLDQNLERAWRQERENAQVQAAVDRGLPKTKLTGIPFRMEMSGFARLEGSLPVTADIGVAWPVLAMHLEELMGLRFDFIPAPQETPEGKEMREWIAADVAYLDRTAMYREAHHRFSPPPGPAGPALAG